MLRDRLLTPRGLVYLIVAWGVALAVVPHPADAAPLPPARDGAPARDLDAVRALLEAKVVRAQLTALGVSPAEAAGVLDRLTPAERSELAARADEVRAGGSDVAFLAYAIIIALLVILVLELMGRRVISRP